MANSKFITYFIIIVLFCFTVPSTAKSSALVQEIKQQSQEQDKEPFVGVNIGTDVSDLLSPTELVSFLQVQRISHIRLYDANQDILKALAKTKIRVIISVPNNQLLAIGSSNTTAASWVGRNVVAYYPETLITGIAVGDEVLTTVPSSAPLLLPAIQSLYSALVAANLHTQIKVSTPHAASIILDTFPPSQAYFNQSLTSVMVPLLQFLSTTGSFLMMNLYPYYVFMENKGVVPLDNSLFKPLTPSKEMVDPNTLLHYTNVLDAMIDAAYVSMKNLNVTDVVVLVSESGWPSKGDSKEPYASKDNADTYNSNLIKLVLDRSGTPLHPEITSRSGTFLANDTTNQTFCIAMDGVDSKTLQTALDWACGPGSYYQKEGETSGSCDFKGVAMITTTDPSHGSCAFPGSKKVSSKKTGTILNSTEANGAVKKKSLTMMTSRSVISLHHAIKQEKWDQFWHFYGQVQENLFCNSKMGVYGPIPGAPTIQIAPSVMQARSIRRNLTASEPRPNPQGSYHNGMITPSRTIMVANSASYINGKQRYAVNGVSYVPPDTPLKLADYFKISGVFNLGSIPTCPPSGNNAYFQTSVMAANFREYVEIVFQNWEDTVQSWHIDGYSFFVVGMEGGQWTPSSRKVYNLRDTVSRCTTQVYPRSWTAIYVALDNVGMWNIRSENWARQYLGQQFYLRVYSSANSWRDELPIPRNALLCGRARGSHTRPF
ncbi:Glucan endo-1,3-beta-glucosidase 1 [Hibiscus syriacus]|uniref:glucan endo-1,3-beta-D-glucosidase n=1 Tax=Hibiscus syriacus TaxID=106335 RepID=A0A6A2X5K8_HIBSY|nr:Glucan endo-1,3-beta-glucosidase 1 [Hibiscus syriacus]